MLFITKITFSFTGYFTYCASPQKYIFAFTWVFTYEVHKKLQNEQSHDISHNPL